MSTKMKRKGYYKVTDVQILAIMNAADTLSSMIGVGTDFDIEMKPVVKAIDRFLKTNGLKRSYN